MIKCIKYVTKTWRNSKNEQHRIKGPAIIHNGTKHWMQHNVHHRLDGPAVEWVDGSKEWYYHGKFLENITCQEEFEKWLKLKAFY